MNSLKNLWLSIGTLTLCIIFSFFLNMQTPCSAVPQDKANDSVIAIPLDENFKITIEKLVTFASEVIGRPLLFKNVNLPSTSIQFTGAVRIPVSEFQGYFERLLLNNGYTYLINGKGETAVHTVARSEQVYQSHSGRSCISGLSVPINKLGDYSNRGILITFTYQLKHINARQTLTTMSPYFTQGNFESVRSVDDSNSLLITMLGFKAIDLVKSLKELDIETPDNMNTIPIHRQGKVIHDLKTAIAELEKRIKELEQK